MSIYDYKVKAKDGSEVSIKEYEGKVLLIVNTATGCGFTPQFDGLQDLYEKYQAQGFEILDFHVINLEIRHRAAMKKLRISVIHDTELHFHSLRRLK